MVIVAYDVWVIIQQYIEPNPVTYAALSHISQSSRMCFRRTDLWRAFTPVETLHSDLAEAFFDRIYEYTPVGQRWIRFLWIFWGEHCQSRTTDWMKLAELRNTLKNSWVWEQFRVPEAKNADLLLPFIFIWAGTASDLPACAQQMFLDRSFVMAAVTIRGWFLSYTPAFADDTEVVAAAVKSDGSALRYATKRLRAERSIALQAVRSQSAAVKYMEKELTRDLEIMMAAVNADGHHLRLADEKLLDDPDLILAAVRNDGMTLRYAPSYAKNQYNIVMTAVQSDGRAVQFASPELKMDHQILLAATRNNGEAIVYIDGESRKDPEILETALHNLQLFPDRDYSEEIACCDFQKELVALLNDLCYA